MTETVGTFKRGSHHPDPAGYCHEIPVLPDFIIFQENKKIQFLFKMCLFLSIDAVCVFSF